MTKQDKTDKSPDKASRFNFRKLIRSALAAGIVAGLAGASFAQTEMTLPSFPVDSTVSPQPPADATPYALTFAPQQVSIPSASKRITRLLGLRKQAPNNNHSQSTFALPWVPCTEPTLASAPSVPEQTVASSSRTPTICHSTSGKSGFVNVEQNSGKVVTASAAEPTVQSALSSTADVQTASEVDEPLAEESLGQSLSESLTNIEIPAALVQATQNTPQRLPELVKRPPAMQLHIGRGGSGLLTNSRAETRQITKSSFSFSDSSESQPSKAQVRSASANPMNVRIEGEPVPAQVISKSTVSLAIPVTPLMSSPEPATRGGDLTTLSENGAVLTPAIGERLEVGLHESTNVETAQAVSGLSVEHPELCHVLKCGERSVSFVGIKAGQTRVALFTKDSSGERKIEIREVVIAGTENRQADMKSMATEINRSVHNMFPTSKIEIIAEAEGLTVQGYAGSEVEARKIISLIRRTSLQPVVDRLTTYK